MKIGQVVMVRSSDAGVLYGELVARDGSEVTLKHARKCWFWSGAATISELATRGTSKPSGCKFPMPTSGEHIVLGVCEVIEVTPKALKTLEAVPVWTA